MINALIIDDEQSGCDVLGDLLKMNHPEVNVLPPALRLNDAISGIEKHKPDLVFLDIKLGHENGFDVLRRVKWKGFHTIFVTAYSQYAIDAFKVSAVDYLLKPVAMDELADAINKFKERSENFALSANYQRLADELKQKQESANQKLVLLTTEGHEIVKTADILYLIADDNYTKVYVKNATPKLVAKTLKHFEDQLSPQSFVRIHKSQLVNLEHIVTFNSRHASYVKMIDGRKLEVSRRKRQQLLIDLKIQDEVDTVS